MSSLVSTHVSRTVGGDENEDVGRENSNSNMECETWEMSGAPAGEGRSSRVERLVRPPLPGRKALKKTGSKDAKDRKRGCGKEGQRQRMQCAEDKGGRSHRNHPKRADTEECGAWDREGRYGLEHLSSSNSDSQLNIKENARKVNNLAGCSQTSTACMNPTTLQPGRRSASPDFPPHRSSALSLQELPRTSAGELHHHPPSPSTESDPFWMEVRNGSGWFSQNHHTQTYVSDLPNSEAGEEEQQEEEEQEGGENGSRGVVEEMLSQTLNHTVVLPLTCFGERTMSKQEKNRLKCLRRRQRRKERWRQNQHQESTQSSTENPSSSSESDDDVSTADRDGYICAVCLDIYFSPYMCQPCNHVFCEPCLRTLAKNNPTNTPCPLCRTTITHVFFQKDLNQTTRTFFPKEYLSRKQNFQKASCAKWPLPSCRKLFRIFGGFSRQPNPIARHQFPHRAGHHLDALDYDDDTRGWRFDMDTAIIYIYSVNWVIGFLIFCILCYLLFPSF
ncbi:E3 ubiquitin-protein ligase RNF180 [Thalassophryne amazonica]|uniref:E3 ubiquitin-protein ligase RNF180 n=1 Tax=Thalassophryne amazonica TaxID=390379 RepID=UPI001471A9AB|nr:E3 ubiquitin-protein ligase RNF180 [Thalassophryne amazonica]